MLVMKLLVLLYAAPSWCLAPGPSGASQTLSSSSLPAAVADVPAAAHAPPSRVVERRDVPGVSPLIFHPLADPVLTGVGYRPLAKVPLTDSYDAVLAFGSPQSWHDLETSFDIKYGDHVDLTGPSHFLLGLFAKADDLLYGEDLFEALATARKDLESIVGRVNACVFFADPDLAEYERLEYHLYDMKVEAEAHQLIFFHRSKLQSRDPRDRAHHRQGRHRRPSHRDHRATRKTPGGPERGGHHQRRCLSCSRRFLPSSANASLAYGTTLGSCLIYALLAVVVMMH